MKTLNSFTLLLCLSFFTSGLYAGTYTWTGAGDGVSLFLEANWNGIPAINKNEDLLHDLVINSGTPGGGGYNGDLYLGGNNLLVSGGTMTSNGSSGVWSYVSGTALSSMEVTGGIVSLEDVKNVSVTMSGTGDLTLTKSGNPLNNSTLDLASDFTGQVYFSNETPADFTSQHLSKTTVAGSPAVIGTNINVVASGVGAIVTVIPAAVGPYTWNGSVDNDVFTEGNWSNGTSDIGQIDPDTDLTEDIIVSSGTPGGTGGFSGGINLGGNDLTVSGGTLKADGSSGLRSDASSTILSTLTMNNNGSAEFQFLKNITVSMSGSSSLTLNGGGNPINTSTIDFAADFTGQLFLSNELVADVTAEHISKMTVGGSSAVVGTNVELTASGGTGTIVTVIITGGPGSPYYWDGSTSNDVFVETNWSNAGSVDIPLINPDADIAEDLIINSGTPGGASGFTGNLQLGGGSLTMTGGTLTGDADAGIKSFSSGTVKSSFDMSAFSQADLKFLKDLTMTMSDSALLTLTGSGTYPINACDVDLAADFVGNIFFENKIASDIIADVLPMITVDGAAAVSDINVVVTDQPGGGCLLVAGSAPEPPFQGFDHTDTDSDGIPDTVETNLGLNPLDSTSNLGERPNIIYILVDDMGFGELGKFHQDSRSGVMKFDTPNLDNLADEGAMLTHHYVSAPVCAPSRSSFLEGLHQGHASVRDNQFDFELPDELNLPTMMRNAGYYTAIVGKHGLAGSRTSDLDAHPLKRGFDEFFGYLFHQEGHEHYPRNGTTEKSAKLHDGFTDISTNTDLVYTTDVFTARAKKIITDRNTANPDQPFFLYLAYDVPHSKVQVPTMAYPAGGGLTGGLQWTGDAAAPYYVNTAAGTIDSYIYPEYVSQPWTDTEKKFVCMIHRVDEAIADIKKLLEDLNIDDNTLVIFTSDNGPTNAYGIDPRSFQSYANMDGIKRDIWEAGIRVPTIAWWPGEIPAGTESTHPMGNWDWTKTFAEAAKMPLPVQMDGVSLLSELRSPGSQTRPGNLYFEYYKGGSTPSYADFEASRQGQTRGQMQAIRIGNFKGARANIGSHSKDFEIYNLMTDSKESNNLAASMPDLQQQMKDEVLRMRKPLGTAARPYDSETIPAVTADSLANGLNYSTYTGHFPWIPDFSTLTETDTDTIDVVDLSVRPTGTHFVIQYSGYLEIPTTGSYTFYLQTDAAAHFMLHEIQMLKDDYKADHSETSFTVSLEAGLHPINIRYKHRDEATYALNLSISGPSLTKQLIPATMFKRVNSCLTHSIALNEGWNMISSFVRPKDLNILTTFGAVSQDVVIIKNAEGDVAIPSISLNDIGNWNITQAYKVKASSATNLDITCIKVNPSASPIALASGWNMIAYLLDAPSDISTELSSITADLLIAKDGGGNVYIPQFGINGIGNMTPGQGYQLKMTSSTTITYNSGGNRNSTATPYVPAAVTGFFELDVNTGSNATIIIPEDIISELAIGDEIGVFNSTGYLTGSAVFEGKHTAITIWGTDPSAVNDETYMETGDPFSMKVWHNQTGKISEVDFEISEGDPTFKTDGLTILGDFSTGNIVTSDNSTIYENLSVTTYPNPNKGTFKALMNGYSGVADLYLMDICGRLLEERNISISSERHIESFDITGGIPGIYLLEIHVGDHHEVLKVSVSP